jgi:predicted membrane-bound mannosyltransferase
MVGALFLVALIFVMAPVGGKQVHSMFGLFFGAVYVVMGLWMGWRLLATGVAVFALTLVAFYALPLDAEYLLFMGVIVGGGLLLGGLWLRKV